MTSDSLSRREWLTGVGGIAAAAMIDPRDADAQAALRTRKIDTHHHFTGQWNADQTLAGMDKYGIEVAVLSRPGVAPGDVQKARASVRESNEQGARIVHDHPSRFGLFATIPIWDVEGSLREIAYAFDTLKADGICVVTSYSDANGTRWLGDPAFAPVFEELNRRKAALFVHPTVPSYYTEDYRLMKGSTRGAGGLNETALENQFDTARAIMSVTINGVLTKAPDVHFIFSHGGGALPGLHERMNHQIGEDRSWRSDGSYHSPYAPNGFDAELQKLYFDVVRVVNQANFNMLLTLGLGDHLLFGSDYPPVDISESAMRLPLLKIDAKVRRGVERENALRLFPRLQSPRT
jgi:predicted TIM-barrel fold metal-dependent hydrolase